MLQRATGPGGQQHQEAAAGLTPPDPHQGPDQGSEGPWTSASVALGASELVLSIAGQLTKNRLTKEKSNSYLKGSHTKADWQGRTAEKQTSWSSALVDCPAED